MCLDLGKFELGVVGVHLADLLSGRSAENLENHLGGKNRTDGSQRYDINLEIYPLPEKDRTPLYTEWVTPVVTLMISTN